ncbi:MAG: FAD-binding oxidoreductase [Desulfomonile tiedjei]|nr:FAD-binding oxidoreductase [Desulfomonile tiedjei]
MTEETDNEIAKNSRTPAHTNLDSSALRKSITGQVLTASDADFEKIALDVWNKYEPMKRRPQLIVRVADEQDVVTAVKFAQANKLKVTVRGGGHTWCNPSLRNSGMMIDLTNLDQVISIDAEAHKAVVQPIISNREIQAHLNARNLSYPTGHCPPVKVSGYLLSGGMSWNQGVWGPGIGSVEAVELVTPDGDLITADKDQNTDYYWAARGAGSTFFGVVTRYHLKLYELPKAIAFSSYYYPIGEVGTVARWLESIASKLTPNIELSLFMLSAPPELAERGKIPAGKVCMVTATIFADSMEEAESSLKPLDDCPIISKCLSKTIAKPCNFEALFDASGDLWPADHRNHVEAMFSNSKLADVFNAVRDHFLKTPSPTTLIMFAIYTGPNIPAPLPDAAFSMSARYYGGPWTMWTRAEDDEANTQWHKRCLQLLKPFVAGHYIGETDTVTYPHHVQESYTKSNWKRLQDLRKKYDPDGMFFNYFDGLS